jgi:hypothetical protein
MREVKAQQSWQRTVSDLIDALNENSPPYCYFRNTEGDSSDGSGRTTSIDELPRISDQAPIARTRTTPSSVTTATSRSTRRTERSS